MTSTVVPYYNVDLTKHDILIKIFNSAFTKIDMSYFQNLEICSMVPEKDDGTGTDVRIYMYYDQTQDNCFPFRYNGKGEDGNRFKSEKDCMRNCSQRAEALFPMDGKSSSWICIL